MQKSLLMTVLAALPLLTTVQPVAAHGNATGVVKERMDLMDDMKGAMKTLADMFSGSEPFDAKAATLAAETIEQRAGKRMTALFPEGSLKGMGHTEARPEIWQQWERFTQHANQLEQFSRALKTSLQKPAGKPAETTAPANAGAMMGGTMMGQSGHHTMMGQGSGQQAMMMGGSMMAGGHMQMSDEHLASMPADRLFLMVKDTCGQCHSDFRIEKE